MKLKYISIFGIALSIVIVITFLKYNLRSGNSMESKKIQIFTSFYPLYFFTHSIAGDKADVHNITPPAAEPHDYEPTAQEIAKISQSKMLVINGGKFESWGEKIKYILSGTNVLIVTAGVGLPNLQTSENGKIIQDPHAWIDPVLAKKEVETIERGLEKISPENKTYFRQKAQKLESELDNLNVDFKKGLSNCKKKDFITSHAAFGYLAKRYSINQISISGISPDEEPTPRKIAEISDLIKKEKIKIVFFEKLVSPKISQTLANETGASTMMLDPLEGISDDDLKNGQTYLTVMKKNLYKLRIALQCK